MGAGVKLPKQGALAKFHWIDATGFIGADPTEATPAPCITIGWLQSAHRRHIVVATSLYEDGTGDFTVLPIGMLTKIERIKENEK